MKVLQTKRTSLDTVIQPTGVSLAIEPKAVRPPINSDEPFSLAGFHLNKNRWLPPKKITDLREHR